MDKKVIAFNVDIELDKRMKAYLAGLEPRTTMKAYLTNLIEKDLNEKTAIKTDVKENAKVELTLPSSIVLSISFRLVKVL